MTTQVKVDGSRSCHPAEYQIENKCCPKCLPGGRVKNHCNEHSDTSCLPCEDGTYTDQPNGLEKCHHCTNCDSGVGLKVNTLCTVTSDTVCEPLEGFYCTNSTGQSCLSAQSHSSCEPGQYISLNGTASTDTVCSDCSSGTFPSPQCLKSPAVKAAAFGAFTMLNKILGCLISVIIILLFVTGLVLLLKRVKEKVSKSSLSQRSTDEEQQICYKLTSDTLPPLTFISVDPHE